MKFGIVCNFKDKVSLEKAKEIIEILKKRGHKFELEKGLSGALETKFKEKPIKRMASEIVLAIGGDGTILRAFRELGKNKIPVLGINCGGLGFLAEIEAKDFEEALKKIEKKKYLIEERSRLFIQIDKRRLPLALNELTVSASKSATVINYTLKVDKEVIFKDSADGVIISTPTGSTGYALSAGGPVVSGNSSVLIIVPICSLNQNKPLIVSDTSEISINNISSSVACEVIIDGKYRVEVNKKTIRIKKADFPASFVRFKKSFYSIIYEKLRKKIETLVGNYEGKS